MPWSWQPKLNKDLTAAVKASGKPVLDHVGPDEQVAAHGSSFRACSRKPWSAISLGPLPHPTFVHGPPYGPCRFVGLALGACRKPETDLGLDLVDDRDPLGVTSTDTLTLLAYAEPEPPVRTSALSRNVLGSYLDRELGPWPPASSPRCG